MDANPAPPAAEIASPDQKLPKFVVAGLHRVLSDSDHIKRFVAFPLVIHGEKTPDFPLPMIVDEDGVVDATFFFTEPDGSKRMRRACFVGVFDGAREARKVVIFEGAGVSARPHLKGVFNTDLAKLAMMVQKEFG